MRKSTSALSRVRPTNENKGVRPKSEPTVDRLLYTREQVAQMFGGVSIMTIIRWEAAGILKSVRINGRGTGRVFYKRDDVLALAQAKGA